MKIGVLTYHCPPNFGAQLQTVSSVGFLKKAGHEVFVIDWYAKDLEEMYSYRVPFDQILCHNQFTQLAFPLSPRCQKEDTLISIIDSMNLDAIMVGSDALFKYSPLAKYRFFSKRKFKYYYHSIPLSCEKLDGNPFFGAFLSKLQRQIPASTYAVSSQNCPFSTMTREEKHNMKEALLNYRLITVRDKWTKQMVETITGRKDICIYPDPVFSFNQNCYLAIPSKEDVVRKYKLHEDYVLLCFSDRHLNDVDYIHSIASEIEKQGFQAVAMPMPEKLFSAGIDKQIELPLPPLDWYALIVYSRGYIGERMHPIVVCLHNDVPFFSFDEYGTSVRKSFFSREMVYNPSSSKTYSIISEAGFLDNLHSYKGEAILPSPKSVINRLFSFDKAKCHTFSTLKQIEYEKGMFDVLNSLKK